MLKFFAGFVAGVSTMLIIDAYSEAKAEEEADKERVRRNLDELKKELELEKSQQNTWA